MFTFDKLSISKAKIFQELIFFFLRIQFLNTKCSIQISTVFQKCYFYLETLLVLDIFLKFYKYVYMFILRVTLIFFKKCTVFKFIILVLL